MRVRRAVAVIAAVAWPLVVLLVFGLRRGLAERSTFVVAQVIVFASLLVSAAFAAVSGGTRGLGVPVSRARVIAIVAPLGFALIGLLWLPPGASGTFGELGPPSAIMACLSLGLLVALPVLIVAVWALQRAFPSAAGWRGAALGAAVGLVGTVFLTFHCGSSFGGHIALAHGLPIVIGALAGAGFARVTRA
jgi:hypothetical protein